MPVFITKVPNLVLTKERIRKMLKEADSNADGRLNREDLKKVFKEIGSHWAGRRADRCIKACDIDSNGFIDGDVEIEKAVEYAFRKYGDG